MRCYLLWHYMEEGTESIPVVIKVAAKLYHIANTTNLALELKSTALFLLINEDFK